MAGTDRCSNCGEPHATGDVFCENCGLDFLTGTLPEPLEPVTSSGATEQATATVVITADPDYHRRVDPDGVLPFPEPPPAPRQVRLTGSRALLGRERPSSGIFPDVDLSHDPAASSRHALLERGRDGSWSITDLGSTNGTYLGDSTDPIEPHVPASISPGTSIHVGAFTRLDLDA